MGVVVVVLVVVVVVVVVTGVKQSQLLVQRLGLEFDNSDGCRAPSLGSRVAEILSLICFYRTYQYKLRFCNDIVKRVCE